MRFRGVYPWVYPRGLIEATGAGTSTRSSRSRFRGVYPRGLIEASRRSAPDSMNSGPVSAGYTPAASLKRLRPRRHVHPLAGFRGVYPRGLIEALACPWPRTHPPPPQVSAGYTPRGLIEATRSPGPTASPPRVSAGYTPAASLKPQRDLRRRPRPHGFRGVYPAASSKHSVGDWPGSGRWRFRGVYPRGLIEASRATAWATRRASFPRGYTPAASLKPLDAADGRRRARRFRGGIPQGIPPRPH